jgi:hypothetical protein
MFQQTLSITYPGPHVLAALVARCDFAATLRAHGCSFPEPQQEVARVSRIRVENAS